MTPPTPLARGCSNLRLCRSAIIFPTDKQVVIHEGKIALQGWSYSGGGNWVERVEVSNDG